MESPTQKHFGVIRAVSGALRVFRRRRTAGIDLGTGRRRFEQKRSATLLADELNIDESKAQGLTANLR